MTSELKPCPKCDGQGVISVFGENAIVVVDCEECGGDGHICVDGEVQENAQE